MTSETPYRLEAIGGCTVISLLPDLSKAQWADIERVGTDALARLENSPTPALLVDLAELEYMGSAMVALIVRLWKAVQKRDGQMVVVNHHPLVFEVLKLAGLHTVWTIVDTRGEAFQKLRVQQNSGTAESGMGGEVLLGLVAVIGAVAGLLMFLSPGKIVSARVALILELGSSALGLIVGTVIAARHAGVRRVFGILIILASVTVVGVGIVKLADSLVPAPQQTDQTDSQSDSSDSKTKDSKTKDSPAGKTPATETPAGKTSQTK